ncbi:MAG: SagB/ThcOx family dehydrogenase [Deltaproteobacteria bacterium]|nr:SagB/ThcOx family dehydrogenase [Deltaproteobacteria bacterium]
MRTDRRGFFRILGAAVASVSGTLSAARAGQGSVEIHEKTRNTRFGALGPRRPELQSVPLPFKPYPEAERVELPDPVFEPMLPLAEAAARYVAGTPFAALSLSLEELGRLLHLTNGVTGQLQAGSQTILLRSAPSAGALYAGEVYVVAERVQGLAKGVYYYDVANHALARIRPGSSLGEVTRALERPEELENAAAVVLLSNVFGRYTWRYANRGYRYALIDTGHIGENLRLAAVSAGLAESAWLRFHDDLLNSLLRVDGRTEAVCAVHAVGRRARRGGKPGALRRRFVEQQRVPGELARAPVPERYHEATKLVPGEGAASRSASLPETIAPSGPAVNLKSGTAPRATLAQAIRASALAFRREPAALDALAFALKTARGHTALERAPGVDLQLAVHRVAGLASGVYRYESAEHRLVLLRSGDLSEAMVRASIGQEMAGEAAVGFLMLGRIAAAVAQGGERSYRDLLVEAGAIGQRVYLAAEAVGLAARNLAAFRDDELNGLLGLDGRREAVIHLTMFGPGD